MLKAHEKVAEAIGERNSTEAALWMRKHILDFRRGWEMASLSLDLPVELPTLVAEA
jgi:DNA-binding FadR family transcriptional regulator